MKRTLLFIAMILISVSTACAGVMQNIGAAVKTAAGSGSLWAGIGALVLIYIFKAIPNQSLYDFVSTFFNRLGVAVTLGMTKWKWSAPLWGAYVEPWIIDLIENTVGAAIKGFIGGLRSDNVDG